MGMYTRKIGMSVTIQCGLKLVYHLLEMPGDPLEQGWPNGYTAPHPRGTPRNLRTLPALPPIPFASAIGSI